jgi:CHAT domain-containing protein/Tfp pilus assembly protein PilF
MSLNDLAAVRHQQGDYASSEQFYRAALAMNRSILGEENAIIARGLHNLATVVATQRGAAEAERLFREALAMRRRILGEDHPDVALTMHLLAGLLLQQERYEEAEQLLRQALAIRRGVFDADHPHIAWNLATLGAVLQRRGDLAGSEQLYREALELTRRRLGGAHPDVGRFLRGLAGTLQAQGRLEEAEIMLEESALRYRESFSMDDAEVAKSLVALGANLHAQRKYEQAESTLREAAFIFESARLRAGEGVKRATFATSPYPLLAATELELGRDPEAWPFVERAQGRVLVDLLVAAGKHAITPTERTTRDSLRHELSRLGSELEAIRLVDEGGREQEVDEERSRLETRLLTAQAAWNAFHREMAAKYASQYGEVFELDRVQRCLSSDSALVGWLETESVAGKSSCWGYVIRNEGQVRWQRLENTVEGYGDATEAARELRKTFVTAASWPMRVPLNEKYAFIARGLWKQRVAPLVPHLAGIRHLLVIPSASMLGIPVEALIDEGGQAGVDSYEVCYVPSATTYAWLRERRDESPVAPGDIPWERALLIGDASLTGGNHGRRPRQRPGGETLPASVAPSVGRTEKGRALVPGFVATPLAGARLEISRIARLMPQAIVLTGTGASEEHLAALAEAGKLREFQIIHLATHAVVDDRHPEHSAILLSQDTQVDPLQAVLAGQRVYDGRVTAQEIAQEWDLGADLVCLSACDSGLGRKAAGEGYIGFTHALMQAGARSVLVSLWEVEDMATSLLMTRFYQNLTGAIGDPKNDGKGRPMSKSAALREAKCWLRSYTDDDGEHPYEHPAYWSAFILIGDPG